MHFCILTEITVKMDQLKAARAKRGRVYSSVDEVMAERTMIIDLAMSRGQTLKVIASLRFCIGLFAAHCRACLIYAAMQLQHASRYTKYDLTGIESPNLVLRHVT